MEKSVMVLAGAMLVIWPLWKKLLNKLELPPTGVNFHP